MENTVDALVLLNCTTRRVSIPEKLKNMIIAMVLAVTIMTPSMTVTCITTIIITIAVV
jgi:hypothetical protein